MYHLSDCITFVRAVVFEVKSQFSYGFFLNRAWPTSVSVTIRHDSLFLSSINSANVLLHLISCSSCVLCAVQRSSLFCRGCTRIGHCCTATAIAAVTAGPANAFEIPEISATSMELPCVLGATLLPSPLHSKRLQRLSSIIAKVAITRRDLIYPNKQQRLSFYGMPEF